MSHHRQNTNPNPNHQIPENPKTPNWEDGDDDQPAEEPAVGDVAAPEDQRVFSEEEEEEPEEEEGGDEEER